ncbi:MAG: HD-GYP domain-containing protein [Candidatus Eisenbacteria bacterium]
MRPTLNDTERVRTEVAPAPAPPAERHVRIGENLAPWAEFLRGERSGSPRGTEALVWDAVETLARVAGADACSVALSGWEVEMAAERVNGSFRRRTTLKDTMAGRGTAGHEAIRTGTALSIPLIADDRFHHYPEPVRKSRYESVACFPLGDRAKPLGVLTFFYGRPRTLDRREKELGLVLAQSTALAIDNSLLIMEGKQNVMVTVQALIRSLEAKDSETSYHSLRVTQHVTVLAEQLGLPADEVETFQYGATLHDLGKIGILGPVLNKRGKLNPDEYDVVKKHPLIGARIVEAVDYLTDAVPIIKHHHERWDGSGYPDRLEGEAIPLGARVVAVPDFYDALTSERPYRPAYSHDRTIAMIGQRVGTAFDPKVAELFLKIQGR